MALEIARADSQPVTRARVRVRVSAEDRLVGLVDKAPASRGSNPAYDGIFPGQVIPCSNFKIGTQVATLPGACRYRVSAGTGRPGVSIL